MINSITFSHVEEGEGGRERKRREEASTQTRVARYQKIHFQVEIERKTLQKRNK